MERRVQDGRGFPTLSSSGPDPVSVGVDSRSPASIAFRSLPGHFDISVLRNILAFADPKDCYLIKSEDGKTTNAVATFGSLAQARDAQQRLNGKALSDNSAKMIVEVLPEDDTSGFRRTTTDGNGARQQSVSASSSASSTTTTSNGNPLMRHNSRFSFSYGNKQEVSPLRSPDANNARLHTIFSPTSPVANGNSMNSLRHDALAEDEARQLLSETHPSGRNGEYSASNHTTDNSMSSSMASLSMSTPNIANLTLNTANTGSGVGSAVTSPNEPMFMSSRSYPGVQSPSAMMPSSTKVPIPAHNTWTFTRPRQSMPPANPADQNPPCNTLYVGNLPPNTCEDELKALFSRQRGYKRLCFRTKHNGPMCFVEFDDINYAAQTLDTLYGTMLTNSIKGGIRLSFSKNPLGVRQGTLSGPNSPLSPHAPGAANNNGMGPAFATANGPPPGLPVPSTRGGLASFGGGSNGNGNNNNAGRGFDASMVNQPSHPTSAVYPTPSPGGFATQSYNGHYGRMSNDRQNMFGAYSTPTNGTFGGMMNRG